MNSTFQFTIFIRYYAQLLGGRFFLGNAKGKKERERNSEGRREGQGREGLKSKGGKERMEKYEEREWEGQQRDGRVEIRPSFTPKIFF